MAIAFHLEARRKQNIIDRKFAHLAMLARHNQINLRAESIASNASDSTFDEYPRSARTQSAYSASRQSCLSTNRLEKNTESQKDATNSRPQSIRPEIDKDCQKAQDATNSRPQSVRTNRPEIVEDCQKTQEAPNSRQQSVRSNRPEIDNKDCQKAQEVPNSRQQSVRSDQPEKDCQKAQEALNSRQQSDRPEKDCQKAQAITDRTQSVLSNRPEKDKDCQQKITSKTSSRAQSIRAKEENLEVKLNGQDETNQELKKSGSKQCSQTGQPLIEIAMKNTKWWPFNSDGPKPGKITPRHSEFEYTSQW